MKYTIRHIIITAILTIAVALVMSPKILGATTFTYPVAELGNCSDAAACRTYCNIPSNQATCQDFARVHNIEKKPAALSVSLLSVAEKELGCSSDAGCKELCKQVQNYARCDAFAKKNKLGGGYTISKEQLSAKAVQAIQKKVGVVCSSFESCKTYCDQPQNQQTCSAVGKELGLRGGIEKVGPGGCTTETSCKQYCADPDHFQECTGFAPTDTNGSPAKFLGPGGCSTEQACREYCDRNPVACGKPAPTAKPDATSLSLQEKTALRQYCKVSIERRPSILRDEAIFQKICVGTPENFSDYASFCKQNPSKCGSEGYRNYCITFPAKCGFVENLSITPTFTVRPTEPVRCPTVLLLETDELGVEHTMVINPCDTVRTPTAVRLPTVTSTPTKSLDTAAQTDQFYNSYTYTYPTLTPTLRPTTAYTYTYPTLTPTARPTIYITYPSRTPTPTQAVQSSQSTTVLTPTLSSTQIYYLTNYPTRPPTQLTPTATLRPTLTPASNTSGDGSSGTSGSNNSLTPTVTSTQVKGASLSRSFFQMLYDFLFK